MLEACYINFPGKMRFAHALTVQFIANLFSELERRGLSFFLVFISSSVSDSCSEWLDDKAMRTTTLSAITLPDTHE